MSSLAASAILFASLGVGVGLWLIFNGRFVRHQNELLTRFNKTDAAAAAAKAVSLAEQGGRAWRLWFGFKRWFLGASVRPNKLARQQMFELPDVIDMLSVAMSAGEGLFAAMVNVSQRAHGVVASDLRRAVVAVQLGSNLHHELSLWSARAQCRQVADLCAKLQLALVRGTPLAEMLADQAGSIRAEVHQEISRKAAQNETRMLVPLIFLILPITVLFAVYPSLQLLQLTQ